MNRISFLYISRVLGYLSLPTNLANEIKTGLDGDLLNMVVLWSLCISFFFMQSLSHLLFQAWEIRALRNVFSQGHARWVDLFRFFECWFLAGHYYYTTSSNSNTTWFLRTKYIFILTTGFKTQGYLPTVAHVNWCIMVCITLASFLFTPKMFFTTRV